MNVFSVGWWEKNVIFLWQVLKNAKGLRSKRGKAISDLIAVSIVRKQLFY